MPKLSFQYVRQEIPETLLEFLTRRFKYHNAIEWDNRIKSKMVLINGKPGSAGHILETREKIVYLRPPGPEPEVDPAYTVLFEDAHLLAVRKSGNIPSTPSGKYWDNCLVHVLQKNERNDSLLAAHRLDRETSGINLFAKSKSVAKTLGELFRNGHIAKRYQTVIVGKFKKKKLSLDIPLAGDKIGKIHIKQVHDPSGRNAQTNFRIMAHLPGATLLEAQPITGRTHQIRAHLAYLGYPVWGDKLYGVPEDEFISWVSKDGRNSAGRHLLHATELAFIHPITGEQVHIKDSAETIMSVFWDEITPGKTP